MWWGWVPPSEQSGHHPPVVQLLHHSLGKLLICYFSYKPLLHISLSDRCSFIILKFCQPRDGLILDNAEIIFKLLHDVNTWWCNFSDLFWEDSTKTDDIAIWFGLFAQRSAFYVGFEGIPTRKLVWILIQLTFLQMKEMPQWDGHLLGQLQCSGSQCKKGICSNDCHPVSLSSGLL